MNIELLETRLALHAGKVDRLMPAHSLSIYPDWMEITCGCCSSIQDVTTDSLDDVLNHSVFRCPKCYTRHSIVFDKFVGCMGGSATWATCAS